MVPSFIDCFLSLCRGERAGQKKVRFCPSRVAVYDAHVKSLHEALRLSALSCLEGYICTELGVGFIPKKMYSR